MLETQKEEANENLKAESVQRLGGDTYALAFKANNWRCMQAMGINKDETFKALQSAIMVFFIQLSMISFVAYVII